MNNKKNDRIAVKKKKKTQPNHIFGHCVLVYLLLHIPLVLQLIELIKSVQHTEVICCKKNLIFYFVP